MTLNEMFDRLDKRRPGFEILYERVKRGRYPTVVETGCSRQPDNWFGDGQSSVVFNAMVEEMEGTLFSVDIDRTACEFARTQTGSRHQIYCADSVVWLQQAEINFHKMGRTIDVLYLDSYDINVDNWHPSAQHHIYELLAIKGSLAAGSLVAVDDNLIMPDGSHVGKGTYVAEWMSRVGKRMIYQGYQWIWEW
jgi:hypothetical protein